MVGAYVKPVIDPCSPRHERTPMSRRRVTRRTFLAAAGATVAAPAFLRARDAANKLNIAIIGSGGRGAANLAGVASENIVALCDVSAAALNAAAAKHPGAK